MPGSTGTVLIAALRTRADTHASDTALTDAVLMDFLTEAAGNLALEADWPWLEVKTSLATVAATSEYTPPADWLRTVSLVETSTGAALDYRHAGEADEIIGSGRPYIYAIDSEKIILKPIPDAVYTYTHRYVSIENIVDAGAETFRLPVPFESALRELALTYIYRAQHRLDEAGVAEAAYQKWLRRAKDNLIRSSQSRRVRVRPGSML